jgi:hypothetical protein
MGGPAAKADVITTYCSRPCPGRCRCRNEDDRRWLDNCRRTRKGAAPCRAALRLDLPSASSFPPVPPQRCYDINRGRVVRPGQVRPGPRFAVLNELTSVRATRCLVRYRSTGPAAAAGVRARCRCPLFSVHGSSTHSQTGAYGPCALGMMASIRSDAKPGPDHLPL